MAKLEKKEVRSKQVGFKTTELKNQKLETLAKKKGLTKSSLVEQLTAIGYEQIAKKPL